jgi:hypothetical protein
VNWQKDERQCLRGFATLQNKTQPVYDQKNVRKRNAKSDRSDGARNDDAEYNRGPANPVVRVPRQVLSI